MWILANDLAVFPQLAISYQSLTIEGHWSLVIIRYNFKNVATQLIFSNNPQQITINYHHIELK